MKNFKIKFLDITNKVIKTEKTIGKNKFEVEQKAKENTESMPPTTHFIEVTEIIEVPKNDLTKFEKDLLKSINVFNKTKFTHKNFMEWCSDKKTIESHLKEDEKIFEAFGCYVAIKINA